MAKALVGRINVQAIDKAKLFKGAKGVYCDVIIWVNDELDQYGNVASIQQTLTREERDAGAKKIYLGNLKDLETIKAGKGQAPAVTHANDSKDEADSDLPF